MVAKKVSNVPYETAYTLDHPGIVHGFFGRIGGVSQGIYTSLNTGFHKDDDDFNVIENRQRILNTLNVGHMVTLRQVHKTDVLLVDASTENGYQMDAMVTKTPGRLLAIQTADCVPILLADPVNRVIGAVHAGWRSAVAGIVKNAIDAMKSLGAKNISAAIGPCIHQESYEVGQDVFDAAKAPTFFTPSTKPGHYLFDLGGYVLKQLKRQGVENAIALPFNTYALKDQYFSCRRAAHMSESSFGSQLSVIGLV
jgi:YfiH family protein